jgi:predicted transcriptional regulator
MRRMIRRNITGAKRLPNRFQPTVIVTEDDTLITESNKLITKESNKSANNSIHSQESLI